MFSDSFSVRSKNSSPFFFFFVFGFLFFFGCLFFFFRLVFDPGTIYFLPNRSRCQSYPLRSGFVVSGLPLECAPQLLNVSIFCFCFLLGGPLPLKSRRLRPHPTFLPGMGSLSRLQGASLSRQHPCNSFPSASRKRAGRSFMADWLRDGGRRNFFFLGIPHSVTELSPPPMQKTWTPLCPTAGPFTPQFCGRRKSPSLVLKAVFVAAM